MEQTFGFGTLLVSRTDLRLIRLINGAGDAGLTLREVERIAGLSQPTASRLVSTLSHHGIVEYVADKHDLRSKHARLTERGRQVCEELTRLSASDEQCTLEGLTELEQSELLRLLNKAHENILRLHASLSDR